MKFEILHLHSYVGDAIGASILWGKVRSYHIMLCIHLCCESSRCSQFI